MILERIVSFFIIILIAVSCTEKRQEIPAVAISGDNIEVLSSALNKYPDSLPLRIKLIQLYSDSGDYKMAIKVTDDGIKRDSLIPDLWDVRASVLYQNSDTLGAVSAFERAIAIIPLPDYLISIGSLYAQTKNNKALLVADNIFAEKNPKTEKDALFIKGLYYSYIGNKIQSIVFFDQIISMDYTYMYAYREKAIALYDMGKYNEAIAVLEKATKIQNSFDEGYYWLGKCDEKLNKYQEAIDNYKTALMYDKDFVEARAALKRLQPK